MKTEYVWAIVIVSCVLLLCATAIWVNSHAIIRFEMDNNTLEAVKSINWTAMGEVGRT